MHKERERIKELDEAISFIVEKLNAAQDEKRPLSIALCGAFSTGKTSLVNALLDYSIELPTGDIPITHRVTKITYGESNRAVLKFDDGTWTMVPKADIWRVATEYSEKTGTLYIETPSEFLKGGIMLIDTPGFDEDVDEKFDEITKKEIKNADFCILTFHATRVGNNNEKAFIEEMNELNEGFFLPVINCMNVIVDDESVFKRAEDLFENCGNDLIGKGKYFAVYSKKGEVELMGLPGWIKDKVFGNSVYLKHNMPLKHAKYALKNLYDKSAAHQKEVQEQIIELTESKAGADEKSRREQRQAESDRLRDIRGELDALKYSVFSNIYAEIRGFSYDDFLYKVKRSVNSNLAEVAREAFRKLGMPGSSKEAELIKAFEALVIVSDIPEPVKNVRKRGFFESIMYGEYEVTYNNYQEAAISYIEGHIKPGAISAYERIMAETRDILLKRHKNEGNAQGESTAELIESRRRYLEEYSGKMLRLSEVRNDVMLLLEKYEGR